VTSVGDALKATAVVFTAAMLQTVIVSSIVVAGGAPDLLLVVVISLGLLRGSVPGAAFGFVGGLVVDLMTLETLGIASLVLTLAGFWAGRYAETTGRGRRLAPLTAVGVITALAALFGFVLHYLLGVDVVARHALVTVLVPTFFLNLLLALPVHALVRSITGRDSGIEATPEVEVVV
jgi:rod shape-determining protein MreD